MLIRMELSDLAYCDNLDELKNKDFSSLITAYSGPYNALRSEDEYYKKFLIEKDKNFKNVNDKDISDYVYHLQINFMQKMVGEYIKENIFETFNEAESFVDYNLKIIPIYKNIAFDFKNQIVYKILFDKLIAISDNIDEELIKNNINEKDITEVAIIMSNKTASSNMFFTIEKETKEGIINYISNMIDKYFNKTMFNDAEYLFEVLGQTELDNYLNEVANFSDYLIYKENKT